MDKFISPLQFDPRLCDVIVVCCSDGRMRAHVAEFLEELSVEADLYAVPGGPLVLAGGVEVFQDWSLAQKRLKFLAEEHHAQRIILIAHGSDEEPSQCGMAKVLWPHLAPAERVKRQRAALLEAARRIGALIPVTVECYFGMVVGDMVEFQPIGR